MKEKIRRMAAIIITVFMLVSCMPFAAFAENEPATPTDLVPVEEDKQEEPGEEKPVEGETQEESGKEEPAEGETAGGETADGDPAGEDGNGAGTEGAKEELPELHYGPNGLRGTLKAGQEYKAVLRPEYSWNILVTLQLIPRAGQAVSSIGVQMSFDGEKKELTQIENEDPESMGISLQFGVYADKEKEHTISITVPFDTDFILTAVKRPKQETEQEDEEEAGDSEETESGEDGEEPAGETGEEETGTPAAEEEPADGEGTGDEKPDGETEEEPVVPEGNGEPEEQADGEETEGGEDEEESVIVTGEEKADEPEENEEPEAPVAGKENGIGEPEPEPVKNEPATPTDLAPVAEETQAQPVNEGTKAGDTKQTEGNKTEKQEEKTEEPEALPTDEELLALGYYGIQVVMTEGADIFDSLEEDAEPVAHVDAGEILWVRPTENAEWAEIYRADEETPAQYIRWDDVMINQKPETGEEEEEEELPARSLEITSTLSGMLSVPIGTPVVMTAELINFREDDICTYQWQYLDEETDIYIDIDGANELTYSYEITRENFFYTWRLVVLIANAG